MKQFAKAVSLFVLLAYFLIIAFTLILFIPESHKRRVLLAKWLHHIAPEVLHLLGVRFSVESHPVLKKEIESGRNHLILANHLSYVDVLVIAATVPTLFVTSKEVEVSLLGIFAKAGGCLFVERRSRAGLKAENDSIAEYLRAGFNVVLFAEGTTSNGKTVLPFKGALLESARIAGVGILPLCLNYRTVNGAKIDFESGDYVFYYGVMEFFPHLWGLLGLEEVWVELVVLPVIAFEPYQTRKTLADECHRLVCNRFLPVL